jgi:hypothetical protein
VPERRRSSQRPSPNGVGRTRPWPRVLPGAGSVSAPAMRRRWISSTQLGARAGLEVMGERATLTRCSLVSGAMSMGEGALPLRSVVVSERMRACLSG